MLRYLDLYGWFLGQRFKILMEYRVNFIIGAVSTVIQQSAWLLTIWVVMRQIPSLNGWDFNEVMLIYGLITLAQSLNHMFADNLWVIGWPAAMRFHWTAWTVLYVIVAVLSGGVLFTSLHLIPATTAFWIMESL